MKHGEQFGEWPNMSYDSKYVLQEIKAYETLDNPNATKRQKQLANKKLKICQEQLKPLRILQVANMLLYPNEFDK